MNIEQKEDSICAYLLSGIDESFDGITIDNYTIKNLYAKRNDNIDLTETEQDIQRCINALYFSYDFLNNDSKGEDPNLLIDRRRCMYIQTNNMDTIEPVITTLRLYRTSKLGCYCRVLYDRNKQPYTSIKTGFENNNSENNIPELILIPQQKQQVEKEINDLYTKIKKFRANQNDDICKTTYNTIDKMITLFNNSFQVADNNAAFIMRVTILEMLIVGNAELTYKLSRSVATLLGDTRANCQLIYGRCLRMYKARSDFLHNGITDEIDDDLQLWALDHARRVILALIDLSIERHFQTKQQFDDFRDRLLFYSFDEETYFGENAYPVPKKEKKQNDKKTD